MIGCARAPALLCNINLGISASDVEQTGIPKWCYLAVVTYRDSQGGNVHTTAVVETARAVHLYSLEQSISLTLSSVEYVNARRLGMMALGSVVLSQPREHVCQRSTGQDPHVDCLTS